MEFTKEIDRRNTNSTKYDAAPLMHMPDGLLPLWVADMDFPVPDPVKEALQQRVEHGIFGYSFHGKAYYRAVTDWFAEHFSFTIDPGWIVCTAGVIQALCTAVRAFTRPGDAVLLNRPVYYPFSNAVNDNRRRLVNAPLLYDKQIRKYTLDFDAIEERIVQEDVKLYLFCSPHNPVGRVWTEEELTRLTDICRRHDVILVSDEIHCDFVWDGHCHTPLHNVAADTDLRYIVCTAPSKTFNLAGLQASNIIIPDPALRRLFREELVASGHMSLNVLGATACQAAYAGGKPWLDALRQHLAGNIAFVRDFLAEQLPAVRLVEPEGTYLLWLDCSALGMTGKELDDFVVKEAGLWLDGGAMFGQEGATFQRINIACTRRLLEQALTQLRDAVKRRSKE